MDKTFLINLICLRFVPSDSKPGPCLSLCCWTGFKENKFVFTELEFMSNTFGKGDILRVGFYHHQYYKAKNYALLVLSILISWKFWKNQSECFKHKWDNLMLAIVFIWWAHVVVGRSSIYAQICGSIFYQFVELKNW